MKTEGTKADEIMPRGAARLARPVTFIVAADNTFHCSGATPSFITRRIAGLRRLTGGGRAISAGLCQSGDHAGAITVNRVAINGG